jgi:hypothetical protein
VSAVLLEPARDGRLFISGRHNQSTRLRRLEIIQNEAPVHPSAASAAIGNDQGELRVDVSPPRQRFLEALRLRRGHASAITTDRRIQMAARLAQEHGARERWYRGGESAERLVLLRLGATTVPLNKAALDLPTASELDGTIERMAKGFRSRSADPAADLDILLRRAIFAWLVADGELHLKNLAMLKTAEAGTKSFTTVRVALLYDSVTTTRRCRPWRRSDGVEAERQG